MANKDLRIILDVQKNEITELCVYRYLKDKEKNPDNQKILELIINDEERHYQFLKTMTQIDIQPNRFKIWFYIALVKILGLSFVLKLMEQGEKVSIKVYQILEHINPEFANVFKEEQKHEELLLQMLKDTRLEYTGSFVLGLNDALIELTGVLAGLTLSLANTKLIAFIGLVTGVAAALSMSSSEYLSTKEESNRNPIISALITGIAYFVTVIVLIMPYVFFTNVFVAMASVLFLGSIIIFIFNFYISVVKDVSFKDRFLEMLIISFAVAVLNFFVGFMIKKLFNVDI